MTMLTFHTFKKPGNRSVKVMSKTGTEYWSLKGFYLFPLELLNDILVGYLISFIKLQRYICLFNFNMFFLVPKAVTE